MSDSGSRRDIELRIRAQDLSTADFQRVSAAVKELAAAVNQETDAARKGAIGVGELRSEITKLEQAGRSLTSIQTAIDRFNVLTGTLNAQQANLDKAREKLAAYRAQLETSNDSSKKAEQALAGYVKQVTALESQLSRTQTELAKQSATLEKAGIDAVNLATTEKELRDVADLVGTSLTTLNDALINNARYSREAKEAAAQLKTEQQAAAAAARQAADALNASIQAQVRDAASLIRQNEDKARARQAEIQAEKAKYAAMIESVKQFNVETARLTKQRNDQATQDARAAVDAVRQSQQQPTQPTIRGGVTPPSGINAQAGSFLGLRPYELQNLSYQINDVVSGLASGQRVTQIIAQQGGQILQLFSKNLFDILKYLPDVALGLTAVSIAADSVIRAFHDQAALRQFTALLTVSADGARYNAQQLAQLQHTIRDLGVSWSDSSNIIQQAVRAGVDQSQITRFSVGLPNAEHLHRDLPW